MRQSSYLYNSLMEILIQLERDMRKKTTKIPLYSIFLYHLTENKGRVIGNVKKKSRSIVCCGLYPFLQSCDSIC